MAAASEGGFAAAARWGAGRRERQRAASLLYEYDGTLRSDAATCLQERAVSLSLRAGSAPEALPIFA